MDDGFARRFAGRFRGILHWHELDALWDAVRAQPEGWYASLHGEPPPEAPLDAAEMLRRIDEIDALLRKEHAESYCGIVYVDDPAQPSMIKIYDPHTLGRSCGLSGGSTPPRWVFSLDKPVRLDHAAPAPEYGKRWWQRLFGRWRTVRRSAGPRLGRTADSP